MGYKDYTGQKFNRLLVLERLPNYRNGYTYYRCKCDCGNEIVVYSSAFVCGKTKSCGCYAIEKVKENMTKHGLRSTQIYKVWAGIKDRTNPNNGNCKNNYKKLGIKMCKEWHDSFEAFYEWAINNGYKEEKLPNGKNKYTIDRIDNNGNYEPNNCRWVTNKQQSNNQTRNRLVTYNGKTQTLAQWRDELGFDYGVVELRLLKGWSVERAFTESTDKQMYYEYKGEMLNINQIAEKTGLTRTNVCNRIFRGWDMERLMTQPARKIRRKNDE